MNSPSRCTLGLASLTLVLALAAASAGPVLAAELVSGPIQIGPSWGQGDPAHSAAVLDTVLVNHGDIPDRLIRVDCPVSGHATLRNGTLHNDVQTPNLAGPQPAQVPQNGLDLPAGLHGAVHPVTAVFDLAQANQPLTDGMQVPCTVGFAHGGERIVIFTIGETPHPTDEP